ncbi:hypothetical protein FRB99_006742 [Tulasnella sp. 403]|nr:hypothetical protein FRB99_006742 [Tulasnella sp. 403]
MRLANKLAILVVVLYGVVTVWDVVSQGVTIPPLSTHGLHLGPSNATFTTYHPQTQYKTFGAGIDHAAFRRAGTTPEDIALFFLEANFGLKKRSLKYWTIEKDSVTYFYAKQKFNKIEVANSVANVAIKDNKVVAFGANFVQPRHIASPKPRLSPSQAIVAASSELGANYYYWPAQLEYVLISANTALLTYVVQVRHDDQWFDFFVDADSGEIVNVVELSGDVVSRILKFKNQDSTWAGLSLTEHHPGPAINKRLDISAGFNYAGMEWDGVRLPGQYRFGWLNSMTDGESGRCLSTMESRGMGQGWSDTLTFWEENNSTMPGDFTIFSWTINDPSGVRPVPYSVDKAINPYTYSRVSSLDEAHNIGEVWTMILVEVYWKLVAAKGYSSDRKDISGTAGNIVFLRLLMDGLRIQPCNPTFLSARDAIIQADMNRYGGENVCTLWKAFAKRGLGVKAARYIDDFSIPSRCS